jgi:hypothetical protein
MQYHRNLSLFPELMMRLICLLFALFWLGNATALDFQAERKNIETDAKATVNKLSALPAAQQTAEYWLLLSYGYMQLLNKEGAITAVNKALAGTLSAAQKIEALHHKALVYGIMFRDSKAALEQLKLAEAALNLYHGDDKPQLQTSLYESFAQGYNQRGDITQALKYAELSVAIATEFQLENAELKSRITAGRLALQQNNYPLAQQQLSRALELAQQSGDKASIGSIHLRLGMAYDKLGLYPLAGDHLLQAEQFLQMPERRNQLTTVYLTQIEHYRQTGELDKATATVGKAQQLLAELKDPYLTAQLLSAEAQLSLARRQPAEAEQQLLKAAQLFQQLGNRSMQYETSIALAEVALLRQQLTKARAYLPTDFKIDQQPLFLQRKYWDVLSRIHASSGEWQQAYQAAVAVSQVQFESQANQQQQQLGQLSSDLQQKQTQQTDLQHSHWQTSTWALLATLLASWFGVGGYLLRRNRQAPAATTGQVWLKNWAEFVRQLRKDQQRDKSLCLFAVQIQQISEYKLKAGEQNLRKAIRHLLALVQGPQLMDSTVHTDVLWLSVSQPDDRWLQQLQQALQAIQQQLPDQPAMRVWQGKLDTLLGNDWQEADLNGLRELVWYSWQQQAAAAGQILHFSLTATQPAPCSWQADNLRQDINNALTLGLLQLQFRHLQS